MRTVDLFAGCGGLSLGFQNAGFAIQSAYENWDAAIACYKNNFKHPIIKQDLSDVNSSVSEIKKYNPQLIIGGPPCQDFSHAGKRVEASRACLTKSFSMIISQIKPQYFVMENVDRAQKSNAYQTARALFKNSGYGLSEVVLDACRCGVPQKRKRFFCIGGLNQEDNFLSEIISNGLSDKEMTLRDYFGDTLDFQYYYRHPRNYNRRAVFSIDEPAPTIRGVNRPIPKGYPGHPNDACSVSDGRRSLTTLERALIQTFPATYKWVGSKTDMEQIIGNAVPIKLAEYVAKSLMLYIKQNSSIKNDLSDFESWLSTNRSYSARTVKDTVSRVKRANMLCAFSEMSIDMYLFRLQQCNGYATLSTSVKSQIKRAVCLYNDYILQGKEKPL